MKSKSDSGCSYQSMQKSITGRIDALPHVLGQQRAFANAQMLAREKQDRLTASGGVRRDGDRTSTFPRPTIRPTILITIIIIIVILMVIL